MQVNEFIEQSSSAHAQRIKSERKAPVVERPWKSYPYIFNLSRDKKVWEDKNILDVGSGIKKDDPEITFPGAKVCAIDPEFPITSEDKTRIDMSNNTAHEKRAGIVQEIPFDDDVFDLVVSSHAIPEHIQSMQMPLALSEMIRVLKPTGEIRLTPCCGAELAVSRKILEEAGFVLENTLYGSEGLIMIIRLKDDIRSCGDVTLQNKQKTAAWRQFHDKAVPQEKIRDNPS